MFEKVAVAMVVTGALAVGSVGVAVAAPSGGSSGGPSASAPAAAGKGHPRCSRAPRALARIEKAEGRITARLTRLQGRERWAQANSQPGLADRIRARIARLETLRAKGDKLAATISARCRASGTGSTGSTGSIAAEGQGGLGGQGATTLA